MSGELSYTDVKVTYHPDPIDGYLEQVPLVVDNTGRLQCVQVKIDHSQIKFASSVCCHFPTTTIPAKPITDANVSKTIVVYARQSSDDHILFSISSRDTKISEDMFKIELDEGCMLTILLKE